MAANGEFVLGRLEPQEWDELTELVCVSLNFWYRSHGMGPIFASPEAVRPFVETYEALDPGCCVVARAKGSRRLRGGCFFHPRESHVSLGIMAVHPNYFSAGVGTALVRAITDVADGKRLPVRLISSAANMDSFSLYSRAGFVPRKLFQDVVVKVPEGGLPAWELREGDGLTIRDAGSADVRAMAALEEELLGICRRGDLKYLVEGGGKGWHASVAERGGSVLGFLASYSDAHACLIGPGAARDSRAAAALIHRELSRMGGRSALVLAQADEPDLAKQLYAWGGRNVELHVVQVRGAYWEVRGVVMPTFLPETA